MTRAEAFRTLGLSTMATCDDIKKAYRKLVKITHPDKDDSLNAQQRFIRVQTAYEILSNLCQHQQAQQERTARETRE